MGFAVDLSRLFNKPAPAQQVDLFQYKVRAMDGTIASVNAPAAPGAGAWHLRTADLFGRQQGTAPGTVERMLSRRGAA